MQYPTRAEAEAKLDQFMRDHKPGSVIDTDGVPKGEPFQCVDVIKEYMTYFGVPKGSYGNAIAYWYRTNERIKGSFKRVATKDVLKGDIVVLETNINPIDPGMGDGHIGIATGISNSKQVEIYEQNGSTGNGKGQGNDALRKRHIDKLRIAGVLRPETVELPTNLQHPLQQYVGRSAQISKITLTHRVYKVGSVQPRDAVATLKPSKFGGLTYPIEAVDKQFNSVIVTTKDYGRVSLPIASDMRGSLYTDVRIV